MSGRSEVRIAARLVCYHFSAGFEKRAGAQKLKRMAHVHALEKQSAGQPYKYSFR